MKKGIIKKINKIILITFFCLIFGIGIARAEDRIDVEYSVGTNLNGSDIFSAENILPGWEDSKTIRVENDSETDDVNLYFKFDVNGNKKLAEKLKLYVIRIENGSYRIGGTGDRYDLKEADDESLYVDKLSPTKGKQYKVKIKFDKDAGNEYQGLSTDFDIDFEIESEVAGSETEAEILADQGRSGFTGNPPTDETAGTGTTTTTETTDEEPTVQGDQEGGNGDVTVGGAENECQWWPLWVWILALVIFIVFFLTSLFYKFKEQKEGQYPRRFAPAVLAVAVIAFWYFFDKCDEYRWFAIVSAVGALIVYLVYLHLFKKAVSADIKLEKDVEVK